MRPLLVLLPAALPLGSLLAQTNPFVFFPQDPERQTITCASYVGRPDWNNQAEGFQELAASWFRGIGDQTSACVVRGMYHWAADENITTAETYGIILRRADPTGGIDATPAGEIVRISGLSTPTAAGGPRGSFIMTDFFATPVTVPCDQSWFMGLDFPANPAWPTTDGHSLWRADVSTTPPTGEHPRNGAPNANWTVNASSAVFSNGWSYILGVMTDAPTLHIGGLDPNNARQGLALPNTQANLALGGLFPDISGTPRSDGITLRVQDNAAPQGVAFLVAALSFGTFPLPVPGITGNFHLDIAGAGSFSVGFGGMTNGALDFPVFAPNSIAPVFTGISLSFQAAVFDPVTNNAAFTNAQATFL